MGSWDAAASRGVKDRLKGVFELNDPMLTVEEILHAPAEFDHEVVIRSIGPALVFVLEAEAPERMEVLASTDSEIQALNCHLRDNARHTAMIDAYYEGRDEDDSSFASEDAHVERLRQGTPMRGVTR